MLILAAACLMPGAAGAQGVVLPGGVVVPGLPGLPSTGDTLVFHGNYCGPGSRGAGLPPTDALDRACMHHDACTPAGGVPSCACNARLEREAALVARTRRQPPDLRDLASMVSQAATVMPCMR